MGTTDVRGNNQSTQVVTLGAFAGTDSFKIQVNYPHPEVDAEETVAFVRGTNCEAVAHLEAELEALNGISDVTVTGTTDAGPFTITFVTDVVMDNTGTTDRRYRGVGAQLALSDLSGCSGHVTVTDPSYVSSKGLPGEVHRHGTDTGVTTASFPGRHAADTIPLGHSAGAVGQVVGTDFVQLLPPAIDSAVGGNDTVAILGTEDASGNTVLYVICDADTGAVENVQTDADADVAATTLTAGEKFLVGYSLTTAGRVSKPSPREYFTVT
jgi:hypothetical protein